MSTNDLQKIIIIALLATTTIIFDVVDSAPSKDNEDVLTVRIIHTNDMHSRYEETSRRSGICRRSTEEPHCYGGFARIATLVRQIRNQGIKENVPTFFLNAGDTFLGSRLFTFYKWKIAARFLNILRPDVASLGNHEFDQGPGDLAKFLSNVTFPIVAANLDLTSEPLLAKSPRLTKSHVLTANGRKIGIIGYLTPETTTLSQTGDVKFVDEIVAIRNEARKLKEEQNCRIIVALGHSGFEIDKRIAREVEEVDLVIGGHTNTFLYNGKQPDIEIPESAYPHVVIQRKNQRKCYVVQAYAYTKYLGYLSIDFDEDGEIARIEGQPIIVDEKIVKANDVENEIEKWAGNVTEWSVVIGRTRVLLDGAGYSCRLGECNFGNFLADAMIYWNIKHNDENNDAWTDAPLAIHQSGGIRTSIMATNDNVVTMDDIVTALPYGSRIFKVVVTGKKLLEALEWSVHDRIDRNTTAHGGCFLQYSGVQVTYDLSKTINSRVIEAKVRCAKCEVPFYQRLDVNDNYTILMPDFLHNGGDGFRMLRDTSYRNLNATTAEILADYLNRTSPVYPSIEGRIKFVSGPINTSSSSSSLKLTFFAKLGCFVISFFLIFVVV